MPTPCTSHCCTPWKHNPSSSFRQPQGLCGASPHPVLCVPLLLLLLHLCCAPTAPLCANHSAHGRPTWLRCAVLSSSNLMAATVRVSITSVQASSAGHAGWRQAPLAAAPAGNLRGALHGWAGGWEPRRLPSPDPSGSHRVRAPRTSSRRRRTSGAFGAWGGHRHSEPPPPPSAHPQSAPSLPQPCCNSRQNLPAAGQGEQHCC